MTILARRRIQSMLQELAPLLGAAKARDLVRRLNNRKDVDQALPAEMELLLLWALRSLGEIEIEPEWWGDGRRPDVVSDDLVPGRAAAIEIAATTDNRISGEEAMDAIALQVCDAADRALKGAGSYLYFTFGQESLYEAGRYVRRILAPTGLKLSAAHEQVVREWLKTGRHLAHSIRLQSDGLDVIVEYKDYKQTRYHNIFSSMPPETHSLEGNPLFELLVRKAKQLRAAPPDMLKILFVADVGSTLLRKIGRIDEIDHTRRFVSAREIILHFLTNRSRNVDAVITFSPFKDLSPFGRLGFGLDGRRPRRWTIAFFGTPALPQPPRSLTALEAVLPEPHYEGYQARSLFRQGAFSPTGTGQYLGMTITGTAGENRETVHFPARLLLDLLAGRVSEERFRAMLDGPDGKRNVFRHWLDMGMTISGAEMAPRSQDEDDDHLILHFSDDPAARPFTAPDERTTEDPHGED
jgi:hypothetical protein